VSEQGVVLEATRDFGSSIKLSTNAKGDVVIEVKVRVADTAEEVAEARRLAELQFDALRAKYPRP
jgi:hypothetical protein